MPYIIITIVTLLYAFLILLISLHGKNTRYDRYFAAVLVMVIIWVLSNFWQNEPFDVYASNIFLKTNIISGIFIGYLLFLFSVSFPYRYVVPKKIKIIFGAAAFAFAFLSLSDYVVLSPVLGPEGLVFERGPLFWWVIGFIVLCSFYGSYFLILKYKELDLEKKKQITYVVSTLTLFTSAIVILNIVAPTTMLVFSKIPRNAVYLLIFFNSFAVHAVLKHRFYEFKILAVELFTAVIWLAILMETMLSENEQKKLFGSAVLLISITFGILLIKNLINDTKQKEKLRQLTAELGEANLQLRALDRLKNDFISIASHQLRTPLTVIKGYSSMILEGTFGELSEDLKKAIDQMYQSSERLISFVNDLLNVSKIQQGKMIYKFEQMQIEDILNSIAGELKEKARRKNLKLEFIKPEIQLPEINADYEKLRQAIFNFVDNAIKYTEKGGVFLKAETTENGIEISISDTGIGMSEEEIATIFNKFIRVGGVEKMNVEGTGLGLYVSKQIIAAHHGVIKAESKGKGLGSTFTIILPLRSEE